MTQRDAHAHRVCLFSPSRPFFLCAHGPRNIFMLICTRKREAASYFGGDVCDDATGAVLAAFCSLRMSFRLRSLLLISGMISDAAANCSEGSTSSLQSETAMALATRGERSSMAISPNTGSPV